MPAYKSLPVKMFNAADINVVILDFDGVVIESNDIKDKVFQEMFSRFPEYYDQALQYHRQNVSLSRYVKFDYLLERMGKSGDVVLKNKLLADFSNTTLEYMRSVSFVNGAIDFLQALYGKLPIYLASVTPIEDLQIILRDLDLHNYFKKVYGCPPWTKPDAIRDIIAKENVSAERVVLIGDSYGDQKAASETGIQFIGRDSGLEFEAQAPSVIVPDLAAALLLFKN